MCRRDSTELCDGGGSGDTGLPRAPAERERERACTRQRTDSREREGGMERRGEESRL